MNYPLEQLSPSSKIWLFLSPIVLKEEEKQLINDSSIIFLDNWTSHQQALKAGFTILYNRFLIFAVDESMNDAGGCSVDKLFKFVKEISVQFNADFLNRFNVAVRSGDEVLTYSIAQIEKEIANNNIDRNSIVFNTLVSTLAQLQKDFETPIHTTWLNRYLKEQHV